jgi:Flp pilus assembly protein TadG
MDKFYAPLTLYGSTVLKGPSKLRRDTKGQVAILFGLLIIPVLFASGAAIDYGRRSAAKTQLDAALDGALLAAIAQKSNVITDETVANMEAQFRSEASKIPGVKIISFTPGLPTNGASNIQLATSYTASINTTIGKLMNVPAMRIEGEIASTRNLFQYTNFYLLLDNSPSMGLAATDADVRNMKRVTKPACAFACHEYAYVQGRPVGDNLMDNYHIARNNNIKLRIDVLQDAVAALVDRAKDTMALPQQFQMEMWTFNESSKQNQLQPMTSDLNSIKDAAKKIDIAYSYFDHRDNQTDFERAISKMTNVIPASGSGLTSASPIRFLFFVTDGVQDTGGTVSNESAGNRASSKRFISPISPSTCAALKNNNVRIGIVYPQYLPIYEDFTYNAYVRSFENNIGPALQACASEGLYFPVSSGGDITGAMLKMFSAAVASIRLSN